MSGERESLFVAPEYGPVFTLAHDFTTHVYGCKLLADGAASEGCTCGLNEAFQSAMKYVSRLESVLLYIANYEMSGTELTLHIDFQGKAREVLKRG